MRTIIKLSNGKRVANFSSPHSFIFEDGRILPAVSNKEAERLRVTFHEEQLTKSGDITLTFDLSEAVKEEMRYWEQMHYNNEVDVVFCPFPMIQAINQIYTTGKLSMPFRSVYRDGRVDKKISITKQCI